MVLTWVLPTTLEDVLAASLAGLAGYIALLNLPLKRAEAKAKLQSVADSFLQVRLLAQRYCSLDCADPRTWGQLSIHDAHRMMHSSHLVLSLPNI